MYVVASVSGSPVGLRQGRASRRPFCGLRPHCPLQPATGRRITIAAAGGPSIASSPTPTSTSTSSGTEPLATPPSAGPTGSATGRRSLLLLSAAAAAAGTWALPSFFALSPPANAKPGAAAVDAGDWSSPGLGAPVDPSQPRFVRLPSGVRFQELNVGSGPTAGPGDTVLFDYVLRRSNGYFIYGTVEGVSFQPRDVPTAPVSYKLGSGQLIPGLEEVLSGMSPGSKRRALIPPELGYVGGEELPQPPTFATKRQLDNHRREPLLFEVQMLRVGGRK